MMRRALLALLGGLAVPDAGALAQGQVYEPAPPRGSAFVRFVNTLQGAVQLRPDFLPAQGLGTEPSQRVGSYTVVENVANRTLRVEVSDGARRGQGAFRASPDSFVTVLIHRGADGNPALTALAEETDFNRARARLAFYNALPDCPAAALQLLPGGQTIFADVPALGTRARSVNPVTAEVRAVCGQRASTPVALLGLEAGGMYSVLAIPGEGGTPTAFVTRDVTAPIRR
ncbi:MAG: alginate O-acetyltransferase AlgF [Roseococcus sp.]|nr:alginate O-acetyltransferase AlgF [Roseococcus sp.]